MATACFSRWAATCKRTDRSKGPRLSEPRWQISASSALSKNPGLKLVRADVGDRYVLEEMQRTGANLGGEQSGHILFLDDATTGDGMLTAVKIASLVALKGPLDSLVADLKIFPQTIVNVRVRSKPALDTLPEIAALLAQAEHESGQFRPNRPAIFRHRASRPRHGRSRARRRRPPLVRVTSRRSTLLHRRRLNFKLQGRDATAAETTPFSIQSPEAPPPGLVVQSLLT